MQRESGIIGWALGGRAGKKAPVPRQPDPIVCSEALGSAILIDLGTLPLSPLSYLGKLHFAIVLRGTY